MVIRVEDVCRDLELDAVKCNKLERIVQDICSGMKPRVRKRSVWQECITSRRKGKAFDPQAIKELAKEYHAGKCP